MFKGKKIKNIDHMWISIHILMRTINEVHEKE